MRRVPKATVTWCFSNLRYERKPGATLIVEPPRRICDTRNRGSDKRMAGQPLPFRGRDSTPALLLPSPLAEALPPPVG